MKTLVIHPIDPTTHFLEKIYEGKDWTILRPGKSSSVMHVSKKDIKEAIKDHDRIVMLGHGTQDGLLGSTTQEWPVRFAIDSSLVKFVDVLTDNIDEYGSLQCFYRASLYLTNE